MKSRSYCEIAIGSLLLLAGCPNSSDSKDGTTAGEESVVSVRKEDRKADEKKADVPSTTAGFGTAGGDDAGGDSGEPEGETGHEPLSTSTGAQDGCEDGEIFEDHCMPKEKVSEILKERDREAVAKVQQATKPSDRIKAASELLEQQIYQVDKTEDDLDEIIEQLRQEKLEKENKFEESND